MEIFNRNNSRNTGKLEALTSYMLISPHSSSCGNLSIQVSEVPAGSEQPVHAHEPEQCYYIISGKGLMIIEDERREVCAGDAIHIPPNRNHGIKNTGNEVLEYLTANSPCFSKEYEDRLWPANPKKNRKR
jgi:mannose-6-phosphate isomerase-like protein (cupin superfamily)